MVKDEASRPFNENLKICVHPPFPCSPRIYLSPQLFYYQLLTVKLHLRPLISIRFLMWTLWENRSGTLSSVTAQTVAVQLHVLMQYHCTDWCSVTALTVAVRLHSLSVLPAVRPSYFSSYGTGNKQVVKFWTGRWRYVSLFSKTFFFVGF